MIDSDLALSFAFAAVTNLARLHDLRPQQLPATSAGLRKSEVEPTSEVFHAILDAKDGSSFWIRDGIVHRFVSSESFLQRRDDRDVERFRGEPKVGSNDVVQI